MKKLNLLIIIVILVIIISSNLLNYYFTNQNFKELIVQRKNTNILPATQLSESSQSPEKQTSFTVSDRRIVINESPESRNLSFDSKEDNLVFQNPYIIDIGAKENDINIYSLKYFEEDGSSENYIPWLDKTLEINIDSDPEKEIVSEWIMSAGGSDGIRCISILSKQNEGVIPISYLPDFGTQSYLQFSNIATDKNYKINCTIASFKSEYLDLNKDNRSELLFYWYDWLPDESHYEPHYWNLTVYEINNNETIVAKWWNNGDTFKTKEKLGFDDKDKETILKYYQDNLNQTN